MLYVLMVIAENCNSSGCSEEDVDGFLVECIWNAVNYNGSDNLMNWNFDFEPNRIFTITSNILVLLELGGPNIFLPK